MATNELLKITNVANAAIKRLIPIFLLLMLHHTLPIEEQENCIGILDRPFGGTNLLRFRFDRPHQRFLLTRSLYK